MRSFLRPVLSLLFLTAVSLPVAALAVDADEDGAEDDVDCDDSDPLNFPDNDEVCDGQDNDCDGLVDDVDDMVVGAPTWFPDADGDGVGVLPPGPTQCAQPAGMASETIDCDDDDPGRFPGNPEICDDGIDQDCDDDRRDTEADDDQDGDGETPSICGGEGTDCDDSDEEINTEAEEVCDDDVDQDCDGVDTLSTDDLDGDGENPAVCGRGATDCDDTDPNLHTRDDDNDGASPCVGDCDDNEPLAALGSDEVCDDGIDNDCNGGVDDIDLDGDGWISPDCAGGDDCDDENRNIHPAPEDEKGEDGATCVDEIDNDCDGLIDAVDDDCFQEPEVDGGVSRQDRYLGGTILVELDGSDTTDGNLNDTLTYTWTMLTDASAYAGVTAELLTDPANPVAYLRFSAEPGGDLDKWVFEFQLVVSDGVFTTGADDDDGHVRVEIFRPTVFPADGCTMGAPPAPSAWGAALALGMVGLIRRRTRRTL